MENSVDVTFWAFVTTAIIGITTALIGWLRKGGHNETNGAVHNAAIIDSSLVHDLLAQMTEHVIQTRRIAVVLEELREIEQERDERKAMERRDSELVALIAELRREIIELKRD